MRIFEAQPRASRWAGSCAGPFWPQGHTRDTIVSGQTAVVACAVVNEDASEGTWNFTIASDSSVTGAASYVETRPAPTTLPPETFPPIRPAASLTDPRFDTCKDAKAHGYGRYREGVDPEYDWYRDADSDGIACE